MNRWFDERWLARSAAYHRPLLAVGLAGAAAAWTAFVVLAGTLGPAAGVSTGSRALHLGVLAGLAQLAAGLPVGAWRELHHGPRHAPPFDRPVARPWRLPSAGLPPDATGRIGATGGPPGALAVVVVVVDRLTAALGVGTAAAVAVVVGSAWGKASPVIGLGVVPLLIAAAVPVAASVAHAVRRRADRVEPLVAADWSARLQALATAAGGLAGRSPMPAVRWWTATGRLRLTGERAWVRPGRGAVDVVLDRSLLWPTGAGTGDPVAALAVAAHELGHVRTMPRGQSAAARRLIGPAALAVAVGALVRLTAGGPTGPRGGVGAVHLAAAAVLPVLLTPALAACRRAEERRADAVAAQLLPGASTVDAVRRLLLDAGVALDPGPLARCLGAYPPPAERLAVLAGGAAVPGGVVAASEGGAAAPEGGAAAPEGGAAAPEGR